MRAVLGGVFLVTSHRRTRPSPRPRPLTPEQIDQLAADYQARCRALQAVTRARSAAALGMPTEHLPPAAPGAAEVTLTLLLERGEWISANHRSHPLDLARRRRRVRDLAMGMALEGGLPACAAVRIRAVGGYPTTGRADPENAQPVVKAAIDGLVDAGVVPDDDHRHVAHDGYRRASELAPPGRHLLRLHITPSTPIREA